LLVIKLNGTSEVKLAMKSW